MSRKPKLLDLFCGAGGAGMGYHRAGFEVTGVDINAQPFYPFKFVQADAMEYLVEHGGEYDFIHASPPCQHYSGLKALHKNVVHPDLVILVRSLLVQSGKPYIIENVVGCPLVEPVVLCGTMFGLGVESTGAQLRRHRLFEVPSCRIVAPPCRHNNGSAIGVYGGGADPLRRRPATVAIDGYSGGYSTRDNVYHYGHRERCEAMGIRWMSGKELTQAIPPAYTEFIGRCLLEGGEACR